MFCGKCGKEVPKGYEFCMNCGSKIEVLSEQFEDVDKGNKKKKWVMLLLIAVVVLAIVIGTIVAINVNQKKNGLYNNVEWGTSFDEIKEMVERNSEDDVIANEEEKTVFDNEENYQGFEGVNAIVFYKCDSKEELQSVYLIVSNGDDSKYTDEMLYEGLVGKFEKLYGECEDESFKKVWTAKKSTITLVHMMEGMLTVEYEPVKEN